MPLRFTLSGASAAAEPRLEHTSTAATAALATARVEVTNLAMIALRLRSREHALRRIAIAELTAVSEGCLLQHAAGLAIAQRIDEQCYFVALLDVIELP